VATGILEKHIAFIYRKEALISIYKIHGIITQDHNPNFCITTKEKIMTQIKITVSWVVTQQPRREPSSYSPPREPQIALNDPNV
jgi:hypothetical protein